MKKEEGIKQIVNSLYLDIMKKNDSYSYPFKIEFKDIERITNVVRGFLMHAFKGDKRERQTVINSVDLLQGALRELNYPNREEENA